MDQIGGYFSAEEVSEAGLNHASIKEKSAEEVSQLIESGEVQVVDVRGMTERREARIPNSEYLFLGKMMQNIAQLNQQSTYVFQCQSGGRSVVASSIASRAGIEGVINLKGGIGAWQQAGLPVQTEIPEAVEA